MRVTRRWWLSLTAVGAAGMIACTNLSCSTVELTAHGGFAYVYDPQKKMVEIAFMKSVSSQDYEGCDVHQEGVDLKLDEGKLLETIDPDGILKEHNANSTSFDVTNATITFEGADDSGVELSGPGRPGAPFHPADVTKDDHWKELKWVPDTGYKQTKGEPREPLVPDWRTSRVSGRMVLTQGEMWAGKPSDGAALLGTWKFRKKSDTGGTDPNAFEQSISDRTHYRVKLSGKKVVIKVVAKPEDKDKEGTAWIVVKPSEKRGTVGLMLIAKHPPHTPAVFKKGDPIEHFCAFYTLLQNPPPVAERLIPHYNGVPSTSTEAQPYVAAAGGGWPTPGAYCPGDWP